MEFCCTHDVLRAVNTLEKIGHGIEFNRRNLPEALENMSQFHSKIIRELGQEAGFFIKECPPSKNQKSEGKSRGADGFELFPLRP